MPRTNRPRRGWALARRSRRLTPSRPLSPEIRVEHVDDPEAPFRLVRVAGALGPSTFGQLLNAWSNVEAPYALHLDLGDVRIDDDVTMQQLERALDHLERQRIDVRLVGIDPHHPELRR